MRRRLAVARRASRNRPPPTQIWKYPQTVFHNILFSGHSAPEQGDTKQAHLTAQAAIHQKQFVQEVAREKSAA